MSEPPFHLDGVIANYGQRTEVFAYCRVSRSDEDLSGAIEAQIAQIASNASNNRWVAERYYTDRGVNLFEGSSRRMRDEQDGLERLFQDLTISASPNKLIVATNVDRLCRNLNRGRDLWERAESLGVQFFTLSEGRFEFTSQGQEKWLYWCEQAEAWNEENSRRTTVAMQSAAERGVALGSLAFGLVRDETGRAVVDQADQDLLTTIFQQFLRQVPDRTICTLLAANDGWVSRNHSLRIRNTQKAVSAMRTNPLYAGMWSIGRHSPNVLRRGAVAGVITPEQFFQIQLLNPKRVEDRNVFYMLGRVRCGVCRQKLVPSEVIFWDNEGEILCEKRAYICNNSLRACRPSGIHELDLVHRQVEKYMMIKEKVEKMPGLYKTWVKLRPAQRPDFIKRTFPRAFSLTKGQIEVPRWAR